MAEKQLCRRVLGGNGGQQVEDEPAICPCGTKANSLLDCVNRSLGSRSRKVIISFYFSTFKVISRPASPVWGSQHKEYIDKLEQVQRRAINMTRVYKED